MAFTFWLDPSKITDVIGNLTLIKDALPRVPTNHITDIRTILQAFYPDMKIELESGHTDSRRLILTFEDMDELKSFLVKMVDPGYDEYVLIDTKEANPAYLADLLHSMSEDEYVFVSNNQYTSRPLLVCKNRDKALVAKLRSHESDD